ncbi:MAG TPA: PEP-CTERM sorting domain-containing protein [Gemmataceae bacterium]|jgi:hypothetical protein
MFRTRFRVAARIALGLSLAAAPARAVDRTWTNTAGGNWGTAGNWSGGAVPTAADNALFTTPGTYTVTLSDARSITDVSLAVSTVTVNGYGGNLTLGGTMSLSAGNWAMGGVQGSPDQVTGGTITRPAGGTGTFTVGGEVRLTNTQVNGSALKFDLGTGARLRLSGSANFLPGSAVTFATTGPVYSSNSGITYESGGTLDNATVNLGRNVTLGTVGGQSLTIGPNALVVMTDPQVSGTPSAVGREFYDGTAGVVTLTNQGTIRAAAGAALYVGRYFDTGNNPSNVALTNSGLIDSPGFTTINANTFTNAAGGVVRAGNGGEVFVFGRDSWANQGTFDVSGNGSTLLLGGTFTRAGIGTVTRSGTTTIAIDAARMDNSGGTFALSPATGNYQLWGEATSYGEIIGGAISATGGAKLEIRPAPGSNQTVVDAGYLTGVQVGAGVLDFSANLGKLIVRGNTTLAAGDTVTLAGNNTAVEYLQTQQVDGVTFALSGAGSQLAVFDNNTLTLGPTTTVQKTGSGSASLVAELVFQTTGTPAIDNRGTINVLQGTLTLSPFNGGTITNRGTVRVDAGATLTGALPTNGGVVRGGGLIQGNVTFTGTGNELRPGPDATPGTLTVTGNVALNSGTTFFARLNGSAAGAGYDRLAVNGTVDLGGSALSAVLGGGYAPASGDKLFLLTNDSTDAITGRFAGLPNDGATVPLGGYAATISYSGDSASGAVAGGNDVVLYNLTPVPEPGTMMSVAATAAAAAVWRLRRRAFWLRAG